jgi:vancomycin resistance protein YoaR
MAEEGLETPVDTGATQRVRIQQGNTPKAPTSSAPRRPQNPGNARPAKNWWTRMSKKDRTTIIALGAVAAVLLLSIFIALMFIGDDTPDDGKILNNVYVAGVNLGGMDQNQATEALNEVAQNYDKLDMVIKILDQEIRLKPGDTGVNLDVAAAVKAALAYGRDGEKVSNQKSHTISIIPYLNLNIDYIQSKVDALGQQYSTLRSDPTYEIVGDKPSATQEVDTSTVHQTLKLFTGTAQYDFSADDLYQQILDAYDSNIFEVVGQCTVTPPKLSAVDLLTQIYQQHCWNSVDASIDENYNVTAEVYGYGFDLDAAKDAAAAAPYGQTLYFNLTFVKPSITAEDISGNLFQNVLGAYKQPVEDNNNLVSNIRQVLSILNGMILKSGDSFSFNTLVGATTQGSGYKPYSQFVGTVFTEDVYGGGISQVASALYACALQAELEITERHAHAYAPSFTQPGLDADIQWGTMDLKFKNTTTAPIRIIAEYADGQLTVSFVGTETRSYTVELVVVKDKIYNPVTLIQVMPEGNTAGYTDGQIVETGITGYLVSVIKRCTYVHDPNVPVPTDKLKPFDVPVGQTLYAKRNTLQISIYIPPVTEPPTDATDPSGSTGGSTETTGNSSTGSTETTGSTENTKANN